MTKSGAPTGGQVTAVLQSLAVQRASGVLEIDGNPAGAIYFDRGHITFARASQVPDLVARLTYLLRPSGELGHLLHGGDQPDRDMGALLLQHRAIGADQLQAIMRSAVVDAVLVFSVPVAGESFVSDIRFQVPGAHWAGSYFRLPVDMVRVRGGRPGRAHGATGPGAHRCSAIACGHARLGRADTQAVGCRLRDRRDTIRPGSGVALRSRAVRDRRVRGRAGPGGCMRPDPGQPAPDSQAPVRTRQPPAQSPASPARCRIANPAPRWAARPALEPATPTPCGRPPSCFAGSWRASASSADWGRVYPRSGRGAPPARPAARYQGVRKSSSRAFTCSGASSCIQ